MRLKGDRLNNPIERLGRQSLTVTNKIYHQLRDGSNLNPLMHGIFLDDYYSVCLEPGVCFDVKKPFSRLVCLNCVDIIRRRDLKVCDEFLPALFRIALTSGLERVTVSIRNGFEVVTLETSEYFRYVENGFPGFTLELQLPIAN